MVGNFNLNSLSMLEDPSYPPSIHSMEGGSIHSMEGG